MRTDEFFTEAWQSKHIASTIASAESDSAYFLGLFDGTEVVGRFTLSRVVRAAFQRAGLGYWVDEGHAGKGLGAVAVTTRPHCQGLPRPEGCAAPVLG